jgi:hypothetical protein
VRLSFFGFVRFIAAPEVAFVDASVAECGDVDSGVVGEEDFLSVPAATAGADPVVFFDAVLSVAVFSSADFVIVFFVVAAFLPAVCLSSSGLLSVPSSLSLSFAIAASSHLFKYCHTRFTHANEYIPAYFSIVSV